ncbi:hypothetical protein JCM15060_20960 [Halanaerobaculum tunisiense]
MVLNLICLTTHPTGLESRSFVMKTIYRQLIAVARKCHNISILPPFFHETGSGMNILETTEAERRDDDE